MRRVHQEDLCQALGIDPSGARGRAKYEQGTAGPSFKQAARLLDAYATDPLAELDRLVAVVTYTVAIGNADAHGKNLALLHPDPETISLAPLYDTVPTALWPRLRSDAAMAIGGQVALADVGIEDIVREAIRWYAPRRPRPPGRRRDARRARRRRSRKGSFRPTARSGSWSPRAARNCSPEPFAQRPLER